MNRIAICTGALVLLSAASAAAGPAYVPGNLNLRAGPGTNNEIIGKIPGGSLVDATNCAEGWCEVVFRELKGFAIQTGLDLSGRVPARRITGGPARVYPVAPPGVVVAAPPPGVVVVAPGPYYRPYYRPYWRYRYGPYYYRRW
jgi:uncharacterized protein YraI